VQNLALIFDSNLFSSTHGFETKQHVANVKHPSGVLMIDLPFDLYILLTAPLIFTGGSKSAKFGPDLDFEPI